MSQQYPQQPAWQPPQQQPGWGAPPPRPPKKRNPAAMVGIGCLGVFAAFIVIGSIASVLDDGGKADAKPTANSAAEHSKPSPSASHSTGLSKHELTKLTVGLVWGKYTAAQRDDLCLGVDMYGPDWFAKQLKTKSIDREYAAQLVKGKCDSR